MRNIIIIHAHVCVSQCGRTALMIAAENGHSDIVTVLLEAGANVNIQDHVSAHLVRKKSCACVYMYRE